MLLSLFRCYNNLKRHQSFTEKSLIIFCVSPHIDAGLECNLVENHTESFLRCSDWPGLSTVSWISWSIFVICTFWILQLPYWIVSQNESVRSSGTQYIDLSFKIHLYCLSYQKCPLYSEVLFRHIDFRSIERSLQKWPTILSVSSLVLCNLATFRLCRKRSNWSMT